MMKTRKKSKQPPAQRKGSEELAAAARGDLGEGRFREAIAGFKELLKREPSPQVREALAAAYAGRAEQLSEKGLLKEALVMWENRRRLGADVAFDPRQAVLLLRLGDLRAVLALYRDEAERLPAATAAELRSHLAAHWLAGNDEIAAVLPGDDPILVQGAAAREALAAYCRGDEPALAEALGAIPFRSPYRDLVAILKALQRLPSRPDEAAALLRRGAAVAPGFADLHRAAVLAAAPEKELFDGLRVAGEATQRFALTLRGWDETRQALWLEIARLGANPPPAELLRVMQRHRGRLGADWVRRRGLRLLIEDFPKGLHGSAKSGLGRLSDSERHRLAAWSAERKGDPWDILGAWKTWALDARSDGEPAPGSDAAVQIALALRRGNDLIQVLEQPPADGDEELARAEVGALEESLRYDPDHRDSYLTLIRYYLRRRSLKEARRLLGQAMARWPQDVAVLTRALETAIAGGSFKKAAGLAREILALDPINAGARERLVDARLAHARKQVRNGRTDLARRELAEAAAWANSERLRERHALTAAFAEAEADPAGALERLRELGRRLEGPLCTALVVTLEAAGFGFEPQATLKALGLPPTRGIAREDLLAFLARLRTHLETAERLPRGAGRLFDKPLKSAAALGLSFQEALGACETLRRAGLDSPRGAFAKAALKRWRGAPVFELHAFEATYRGGSARASDAALNRLDAAICRAIDEGDRRTAHRLRALLEEIEGPLFTGAPPPFPFEAPPEEMLRSLINILGLDRMLDQIGVGAKEKAEIKRVERKAGREGVIELLLAMMHDAVEDAEGLGDLAPGPPPRPKGPVKAPAKKKAAKDEPAKGSSDPRQLDLFE